MEIIILLIVVSVIANIIKSAGRTQQQSRRTGRGVPGQSGIPGRGLYVPGNQPPGFDMYPMGEPDYRSEQTRSEEKADLEISWDIDKDTPYTYERRSAPIMDVPQSAPPMDIVKQPQVQDTNQAEKYKLDFSRDSFINGIILSEVLGRPISRR